MEGRGRGDTNTNSQSVKFNDKNGIKSVDVSLFPCFKYQLNSVRSFMNTYPVLDLLIFFFGWTKDKSWSMKIRIKIMDFCGKGIKHGAAMRSRLCVCVLMIIHYPWCCPAPGSTWGLRSGRLGNCPLGLTREEHHAHTCMLCFCWITVQEFSYLWKCEEFKQWSSEKIESWPKTKHFLSCITLEAWKLWDLGSQWGSWFWI